MSPYSEFCAFFFRAPNPSILIAFFGAQCAVSGVAALRRGAILLPFGRNWRGV
jgi:hypothetical protein